MLSVDSRRLFPFYILFTNLQQLQFHVFVSDVIHKDLKTEVFWDDFTKVAVAIVCLSRFN